jgi:hypothetical protein
MTLVAMLSSPRRYNDVASGFAVFVIPTAVITVLAIVEILVYGGDSRSLKKKQR